MSSKTSSSSSSSSSSSDSSGTGSDSDSGTSVSSGTMSVSSDRVIHVGPYMGSPKSTEEIILSPVRLPTLLSPIRSPIPRDLYEPYIPMPLYTYKRPQPWPALPPKPSRHVIPSHLTDDPRLMRVQKLPLHQQLDPRHRDRMLLLEPLPIPHNPTIRRRNPIPDPRDIAIPPVHVPQVMRMSRQDQLDLRSQAGTLPYFEKTGKTPKGSRNCLLYTSPSPRD